MHNPILFSGLLGWFLAQILKTLFHAIKINKVDFQRFVGSGGMPSSHTALVSATLINTGRMEGINSPLFGIAFVVTAVVIYDAMTVRLQAGLHARELNIINKTIIKNKSPENQNSENKIKEFNEFLGHTPIEVVGGAVVGIVAALLIPIK